MQPFLRSVTLKLLANYSHYSLLLKGRLVASSVDYHWLNYRLLAVALKTTYYFLKVIKTTQIFFFCTYLSYMRVCSFRYVYIAQISHELTL